jgi:hypothetical protein
MQSIFVGLGSRLLIRTRHWCSSLTIQFCQLLRFARYTRTVCMSSCFSKWVKQWPRAFYNAARDIKCVSVNGRRPASRIYRSGRSKTNADILRPDPPDSATIYGSPSMPVMWSGLPPSFVASATAWILRSVSEATCSVEHRHASDLCRSTPGALAPVRVLDRRLAWPHWLSILTITVTGFPRTDQFLSMATVAVADDRTL